MPEAQPPGMQLAEFVAAIVIAALAFIGGYLLLGLVPFLLAVILVGGTAFGLIALMSAGISRREAHR